MDLLALFRVWTWTGGRHQLTVWRQMGCSGEKSTVGHDLHCFRVGDVEIDFPMPLAENNQRRAVDSFAMPAVILLGGEEPGKAADTVPKQAAWRKFFPVSPCRLKRRKRKRPSRQRRAAPYNGRLRDYRYPMMAPPPHGLVQIIDLRASAFQSISWVFKNGMAMRKPYRQIMDDLQTPLGSDRHRGGFVRQAS